MSRFVYLMVIGFIAMPIAAMESGVSNGPNSPVHSSKKAAYGAKLDALAASERSPVGPLMAIWAIGADKQDAAHPKGVIKQILAIDPNCKPAIAAEARTQVGSVVSEWTNVIAYFDRRVRLMRNQGEKQLRVLSQEPGIYDVLTPEMPFVHDVNAYEGEPVRYVTDVNAARDVLIRKVERENASARAFLDSAAQRDPSNALYDYLTAQLLLSCGEQEKAILAIEAGLQKRTVTDYHKEALQMAVKAMDDAKIPPEDRPGSYPTQGLLSGLLWEPGISEMVTASVKAGDTDRAKYLCDLMLRVAKQCPGPDLLGRAAKKRLSEIEQAETERK